MGLKPRMSRSDLHQLFQDRLQRINDALIMELQNIGEECANHARDLTPSIGFNDQTGNLRSSIGYVIYVNGRPLSSDFKDYQGPKGNSGEGKKSGEELAKSVASKHKQGVVLVVVAGMNYALYVESKNRDVLSSAEHLADKLVPKMIKQLSNNVKGMK